MMGAMLISSLVIFPALTAMRLFKSFRGVVVWCRRYVGVLLLRGTHGLLDAVHAGGSLCGGGKSRAVSALLCCRLAAQALKTAGSAAVPYIRRIFLYNIRKESGRKGLRFSSICAMMRMLEE